MILSFLLWGIVVILAAIGIVICTPVKIRAGFDTEHKPPVRFNMTVLGGLLTISTSSTKAKKDKKLRKPAKSSKLNIKKYLPSMLQALPNLIRRLLACIKIESLRGNMKFGFPDPADTGQIYGITYPLIYRLNSQAKNEVIISPNYERACISGAGSFTARFLPITLLLPMLNFGWTAFLKPKLRRH